MEVIRLNSKDCEDWLLNKHYLKRMPTIAVAFGLVIDGKVEGICTFSSAVARFDLSQTPYELSRLVLNEKFERNTLSWFLSRCLKMFPKSAIIVSYADENWGHHGYIYQATNWIYTGLSSSERRIFVNGVEVHRRTLYQRYGTSSIPKLKEMGYDITFDEQVGKHRYFYVTGNKRERSNLRKELESKYDTLPYPKGQNSRYDASYEPEHYTKVGVFF